MKIMIVTAFAAAGGAALLSYAGILPGAGLLSPLLFCAALILVLLHLVNTADEHY